MTKDKKENIKQFIIKAIESFESAIKNNDIIDFFLMLSNDKDNEKNKRIESIRKDIQTLKDIYEIIFGVEYGNLRS